MRIILLLLFSLCASSLCAILEKSVFEVENGVKYFLFTKDSQTQAIDIRDTNYSENERIVFVIHGFQTASLDNPHKLKDDIFKYDLNVDKVVVVSWLDYSTYPSPQASSSDYNKTVDIIGRYHVPQLAQDLSNKIEFIQRQVTNKIELIGHCFGAHVAGQAARLYKQETGHGIHKIVGLDPTAQFFNKNRQYALNNNSADTVLILHTNPNKYGMADEIGTKDLFINGGRLQLRCRNTKLMEDICLHNAAWEEYSKYLQDKGVIDKVRVLSQRFVICLDVSHSMKGSRLTRAIQSATTVINALRVNSSMGLVTFANAAQTSHEIVQIKGRHERNSLIARLPKGTDGGTCISAGLQRSMEILKHDQFCSTILLISDGEPNCAQSSRNIIPELNKACIAVNSVALGKAASEELEDISNQTNGVVHYVSETGEDSIQKFIETEQAFIAAFENGHPIDDRSIQIPSKSADNSSTVKRSVHART